MAEDLEKELKEQLPTANTGLITSVQGRGAGGEAQGNSFGSFVNWEEGQQAKKKKKKNGHNRQKWAAAEFKFQFSQVAL